jgi:hypothetical protein
MKQLFIFFGISYLLLGLYCTQVKFNNPIDVKGTGYQGDSCSADDDGDGIANCFDLDWKRTRDKTPPVITFNGGIGVNKDTVIFRQGDPDGLLTTSATVTANDTGVITSLPITLTNSGLFTSQCGIQLVTYTATDAAGNTSTKTRVIIVDCDPPVITLVGENPVNLMVGGTYTEPGAVAVDNIDGTVTVTTAGTVKTNTQHIDTITYTARDRAGNVATKKRLIVIAEVPDTVKPVITLVGGSPYSIKQGTTWVEPGYTAIDNRDGDLKNQVVITGGSNGKIITTSPGKDTLTYTVSDSKGNTAVAYRIVIITPIGPIKDTIPPVIDLIGGTTITLKVGDVWVDPGWTAYDLHDGDLTNKVTVKEISGKTITTTAPGNYELLYSVTDSAGYTMEVGRTVIVVGKSSDSTKPVITLDGCVKCTVKLGKSFTEPGYSATDNVDGVISTSVSRVIKNAAGQVASLSPATVIGDYTITYTVSDKAGNAAAPKVRNVYCKDTFIDPNDLLNKYGVPLASALPTISAVYKTSVTTDGEGAPNVSTVTTFTLAWDLAQNKINQFAFNTSNGVPSYYFNLTPANTFASANPGFTLSSSGLAGFDGQYFIKADATQCVWVKKDGKYAIIFK